MVLGLGSNLGDRRAHLAFALHAIAASAPLLAVSSVWETEPVGYADQPRFWNLVTMTRTTLPPAGLLAELKRIEVSAGRTARFRNGPREIDIDLLLYDDIVLRTGVLEIPHPRMSSRGFVLRPLAEIAPDRRIPDLGRTAAELLARGSFEGAVALFPGETLLR